MSTQGSSSLLAQASRTLLVEWEKTKVDWRDVKSQEFEHTYLEDIFSEIAGTTAAMEEIATLLKKVRSDCE